MGLGGPFLKILPGDRRGGGGGGGRRRSWSHTKGTSSQAVHHATTRAKQIDPSDQGEEEQPSFLSQILQDRKT